MPPWVNSDFGGGAGVAAGAGVCAAAVGAAGVWAGAWSVSPDDGCAVATPISMEAPAINTVKQAFRM
jgi:hypothetical protein